MKRIYIVLLALFISSCGSNHTDAPVYNLKTELSNKDYYTVQAGDSLYLIAWVYNIDYLYLAKINSLSPPYNINKGDTLKLSTNKHTLNSSYNSPKITTTPTNKIYKDINKKKKVILSSTKNVKSSVNTKTNQPNTTNKKVNFIHTNNVKKDNHENHNISKPRFDKSVINTKSWQWPLDPKHGYKNNHFYGGMSRGIDIKAQVGTTVKSVAPGVVVYSGNGISGYDNLIIIKHSRDILTAYGYNKKSYVKLGQVVAKGQPIAVVGSSNKLYPSLHFEIRKKGKAVDIFKYLPKVKTA